jgi:hypothetical protein
MRPSGRMVFLCLVGPVAFSLIHRHPGPRSIRYTRFEDQPEVVPLPLKCVLGSAMLEELFEILGGREGHGVFLLSPHVRTECATRATGRCSPLPPYRKDWRARGWSTKGRGETPSRDARGGAFGISPCAKHGRMSGGLAESRAYRMWSHAVLCCAVRHKTAGLSGGGWCARAVCQVMP